MTPYVQIGRVDDPEWHSRRSSGVGASEAAIMLGAHPKHGPGGPAELWAWKRGISERPDEPWNEELAYWGHVLEPVIVQQFAAERYAGWSTRPGGEHLRSLDHPWALATIDGWTEHPELGWIPLEAKTVAPWIADEWAERTPVAYWWQAQHQALVTGCRAVAVAALVAGGHLMWELIPADPHAQQRLAHEGAAFWTRVEEDRVPVHVPTLRSVAALYPPGGPEDGVVQLDGHEWAEIDEELRDIKHGQKVHRTRRDELEAQLKDAIGNHGAAVLPNGATYTYRTQERAGGKSTRVLRRKRTRT